MFVIVLEFIGVILLSLCVRWILALNGKAKIFWEKNGFEGRMFEFALNQILCIH